MLESPGAASRRRSATGWGSCRSSPTRRRGYVDHLVGVLEGRDLTGMRVVVDCANGAASTVAPEVLGASGRGRARHRP